MKFQIVVSLLLLSVSLFAQKTGIPTESFTIEGNVKSSFTFTLKNSIGFSTVNIDSVIIYNHLMEPRRTIRNVKGILLTDILVKAGLNEEKPKLFSEFYFTCIGSDGYKVVFSWNELFNSETGKQVIIVTEENGKPVAALETRIAVLSASDKATGRRFVHNLQTIRVERVK